MDIRVSLLPAGKCPIVGTQLVQGDRDLFAVVLPAEDDVAIFYFDEFGLNGELAVGAGPLAKLGHGWSGRLRSRLARGRRC